MSEKAWVSVDESFRPLEVFKRQSEAVHALQNCPVLMNIIEMDRREAVGKIRHEIFLRQGGRCIACNTIFTEDQMHMHEKVSRGKGGNISLDNSEGLCYADHLGKSGAHGDRRPKFGGPDGI
jgi:5-methylcytosine-specific restriction endonuclease McrA